MNITEEKIFKLEHIFDAHNKKVVIDDTLYWGKFLKKWKIKYFREQDAHVAWQLFDPSQHILIRPNLEVFSLKPVYLLVPNKFAMKVLVLGGLPK
jgi:hypothetical protein